MALTVKRDQNKETNTSPKDVNNHLGQAPGDIYELENEIVSIRQENEHKSPVVQPQQQPEIDDFKTTTFTTSTISDAREYLSSGKPIQLQLPPNPSPHALIAMTHAMGFDTTSLRSVLEQSSVAAKRAVDDYVSTLKSKHTITSQIPHPYQVTQFGYLFHCKQVDALQCADDLSATLQITMDLDFQSTVLADDLFQNKFVYELAHNIFKCPPQQIQVHQVRAGSVIVIISGIALVTLAMAGVMALSCKLYRRRKRQQIHSQSLVSSPSVLRLDAKRYKEVKGLRSSKTSVPMKVKGNGNDNQVISSLVQTTEGAVTGGVDAEESHSKLVEMGFESTLCRLAVRQYPLNIDQAISWMLLNPDAAKTDDGNHGNDGNAKDIIDASDGFVPVDLGNPSLDDVVSRELVGDESSYVSLSMSAQYSQDEERNIRGKLEMHIGDEVWIKKQDKISAAKVIAMSSTTMTVQYDNGGLFWWKKTEVFSLGDSRVMLRGSEMAPQFEGCVEISKSNGGYIKAWKSGLQRPMADI